MRIEALIGDLDQPLVEQLLILSLLVTSHKHDRCPLRVKSKSRPPDFAATVRSKPQFFHVRVLRSHKSIDMRTSGFWPGHLYRLGDRKQIVLHFFSEGLKLDIKFVTELYVPAHALAHDQNITLK